MLVGKSILVNGENQLKQQAPAYTDHEPYCISASTNGAGWAEQ
jgi:hypothetical protein